MIIEVRRSEVLPETVEVQVETVSDRVWGRPPVVGYLEPVEAEILASKLSHAAAVARRYREELLDGAQLRLFAEGAR